MTFLYLGEHGLVDVESLVNNLHGLPCLLLVPGLELRDNGLVNIVGPVVNFQELVPVL